MTDFAARRRMMVDTQVRPSDVTEFPIIDAMLTVPREAFVPRDKVEAAYVSENLDIGERRVVLEPRTFAKMLDALNLGKDDMVLDIGCGFGYSAAVIAHIVDAVVAVEDNDTLIQDAQPLLTEYHADNVILHQGPLPDGAAEHGPYDAILIEGGVEDVPAALLDQLKDGGRIACLFVENALGTVRIGHKLDGNVSWRFSFNAGAPVLSGFERAPSFAL